MFSSPKRKLKPDINSLSRVSLSSSVSSLASLSSASSSTSSSPSVSISSTSGSYENPLNDDVDDDDDDEVLSVHDCCLYIEEAADALTLSKNQQNAMAMASKVLAINNESQSKNSLNQSHCDINQEKVNNTTITTNTNITTTTTSSKSNEEPAEEMMAENTALLFNSLNNNNDSDNVGIIDENDSQGHNVAKTTIITSNNTPTKNNNNNSNSNSSNNSSQCIVKNSQVERIKGDLNEFEQCKRISLNRSASEANILESNFYIEMRPSKPPSSPLTKETTKTTATATTTLASAVTINNLNYSIGNGGTNQITANHYHHHQNQLQPPQHENQQPMHQNGQYLETQMRHPHHPQQPQQPPHHQDQNQNHRPQRPQHPQHQQHHHQHQQGLLSDANSSTTTTTNTVADMLNLNTCNRTTRSRKKVRRKQKMKTKCTNTVAPADLRPPVVGLNATYTPQYTPMYMDTTTVINNHNRILPTGTSLGGQIPNSNLHNQQYLNGSLGGGDIREILFPRQHSSSFFPSRSFFTGRYFRPSFHRNSQSSNFSYRLNGRRSGTWCESICGWFTKPSLPFIIGILALGGIACTLGGIVLGCTGLIEHSTQYLSAALLMIGIGVSMLVIAGAIWRLSLPDDNDQCACYRHMDVCRNCNSPYCPNRFASATPGSYLYSEFQHPAPPPSYLTSFYDCSNMGLCGPQPGQMAMASPAMPAPQQPAYYAPMNMNTPPPVYRSSNSLGPYASLVPSVNPAMSNSTATITQHASYCNLMNPALQRHQQQQQPHLHQEQEHYQQPPLLTRSAIGDFPHATIGANISLHSAGNRAVPTDNK